MDLPAQPVPSTPHLQHGQARDQEPGTGASETAINTWIVQRRSFLCCCGLKGGVG